MNTAFGRQDFILARIPIERVASAIGRELVEMDRREEVQAEQRRGVGRLVGRMVGGSRSNPEPEPQVDAPTPFTIHTGPAALPDHPIVTSPPPAYDPKLTAKDTIEERRVSIVKGNPDWTLVEFENPLYGACTLALALSDRLPGEDILYFRRSGTKACEVHFDFHLYRDAEIMRRVLCHSTWPRGEQEDEWWDAIADAPLTRYEDAAMYADAQDNDLLTDAKIDAILQGQGLSLDMLFGPDARRCALLFSRALGGVPIQA